MRLFTASALQSNAQPFVIFYGGFEVEWRDIMHRSEDGDEKLREMIDIYYTILGDHGLQKLVSRWVKSSKTVRIRSIKRKTCNTAMSEHLPIENSSLL